jgi:hypothetical protein
MPVTFFTGAEIFLILPAQQRAKRPKGGLPLRKTRRGFPDGEVGFRSI